MVIHLALLANIRRAGKNFSMTNTLAYFPLNKPLFKGKEEKKQKCKIFKQRL
jgi:hypothetical protein